MRSRLIFGFLLLSSGLHGQYTNVLIGDLNDPNEPSILMDPLHTNRLIAGANLNNMYYSTDAGQTWNGYTQFSSYGVWGDPSFAVDTDGNFYHFHLSNPISGNWIDRIVCQKSTDGGISWSSESYTGLNGTKAQDKQWAAVDRSNNHIYLTWTQFDEYGSTNPADKSVILFSRSTDQGATWSTPVTLSDKPGDCIDSDQTMEGAVPTVGPNGEIYVSWIGHDTLWFDRSTDGGVTWLPQDRAILSIPGGWDYSIPGLYRCNGLPITLCDTSSASPHHGTLYINWTDQRNGSTDTDVWLVKSTDGGTTWSAPTRVNDDAPGKHQFLTWMTIDQANGHLWFVFYDRRNYTNNQTDVFLAASTDGGVTFENFKVSAQPFTPTTNFFIGDYNNITAHNDTIRPIWTSMDTSGTSIYTALVDGKVLANPEALICDDDVQLYPNPTSGTVHVSFKLPKTAAVSLTLYDVYGRQVAVPVAGQNYDYGKHVITVNPLTYGLSPGIYYYVLQTGPHSINRKMVQVE